MSASVALRDPTKKNLPSMLRKFMSDWVQKNLEKITGYLIVHSTVV